MKSIKQYFVVTILAVLSLFSGFMVCAKQTTIEATLLQPNQQLSQVNINQASAEELATNLNGVGLNKAKKIVEYREKFGPFVSIEQLKEVSGIGQSILERNIGKLILQ